VQRDILWCGLEKLRDLRLRQSERFDIEPARDARAAILGLVEDEFAAGNGGQEFSTHAVTSLS
jgi:hypothetical protein